MQTQLNFNGRIEALPPAPAPRRFASWAGAVGQTAPNVRRFASHIRRCLICPAGPVMLGRSAGLRCQSQRPIDQPGGLK